MANRWEYLCQDIIMVVTMDYTWWSQTFIDGCIRRRRYFQRIFISLLFFFWNVNDEKLSIEMKTFRSRVKRWCFTTICSCGRTWFVGLLVHLEITDCSRQHLQVFCTINEIYISINNERALIMNNSMLWMIVHQAIQSLSSISQSRNFGFDEHSGSFIRE